MRLYALAREAIRDHQAQQKPGELAALGAAALAADCETAIEIGTWSGGTSWFLRQLGLDVTAVDTNVSNFEAPRDGISVVQGDSSSLLPTLSADLILIDGDHTYAGVKADWEAAWPQAGKLVAFHDIVEHPPGANCHVDQLWAEIRGQYPSVELIERRNGEWAGIGVIFK